MRHLLIPGVRQPLPRHQMLQIILGWDAPKDMQFSQSCMSFTADGQLVDMLPEAREMTKDKAIWMDEGTFILDLGSDTGLTYAFCLHSTERMERAKSVGLAVMMSDGGEVFARYDKPAQFGYTSVLLASIKWHSKEGWRIRAHGTGAHAVRALDMIPHLRTALN